MKKGLGLVVSFLMALGLALGFTAMAQSFSPNQPTVQAASDPAAKLVGTYVFWFQDISPQTLWQTVPINGVYYNAQGAKRTGYQGTINGYVGSYYGTFTLAP
ncbi:hypothetical protein [Schleiferilactobacillus shenzhenensis]|uniref:hypothetical protein n=1 Tax=Schleiferilactobacillus shenzhenensis TaxID=1231337 RepID=UPI00058F5C4F|nr:hypothetical protein [Schleiferilactobacillus shenzhenensis]